ncbi:DNA-binding protein [Dyella silvatica]|uniref:DNA-binding protein n=1 Tax=Dyella silvatica TaxID=2992128 RepID=UPI00224ECE23|nr:DNA-binding protein [Dyella silvatica]
MTTAKYKPDADFANRLNTLCDKADIPADRERITAVANMFAVARETPRLWFKGKVMPEIPRLIEMVDTFDTTLDWLVLGRGEVNTSRKSAKHHRVRDEGAVYETLSPQERSVIAAMRELSEKRRAALLALLTEQ